MHYYDPMFYLCSEKMPFSIRNEITMKNDVNGKILENAVNTAIKRYPYFSVKLENKDGDIITSPNGLPIKVFEGRLEYPLGSREVNYHILALSYIGNVINFHITHVITDGTGLMPFVKTVLYYYVCELIGEALPSDGIRLADDELLEGEIGNPYPESIMETSEPFYLPPEKEYFRLKDSRYVNDDVYISYDFHAKESDVMRFSFENDASPCALFSAIISEAIRDVHPDEEKDIVSAISFNMRPGLRSQNSYRMVCSSLPIRYSKKMNSFEVRKLCTCTRGAILVQSQPENVLYHAKKTKERMEKFLALPDVETKCEVLSDASLEDSTANTFSVSYVGRVDYGSLQDHIESVRVYTDGSVYRDLFLEIFSFKGWFCLTLQQGFSSDVYYRAILDRLKLNGIEYVEDGKVLLDTARIELPKKVN